MRYTGLLLAAVLTLGTPAQSVRAAVGPGSEAAGQSTAVAASQTTVSQTEAEQPEIAAQGAVLYDATRGQF